MDQAMTENRAQVYLVGGWGSDPSIWDAVAEHLERASVRFSTVDWQEVIRDRQALDRLVLDRPAVLVGWSLGGLLALEATLRHPTAVAGLVMIGSTARMCKAKDYPGVDPLVAQGFKLQLRLLRQRTLHNFANLCFTDVATGQVVYPEAAEEYLRLCLSCENKALSDGLNCLLKTDLRDSLDTLAERSECAVKILHTRDDAVIPYVEAEYLAGRVPHSELILLESGTHSLPITMPEKVAEVILSLCWPDAEGDANDR